MQTGVCCLLYLYLCREVNVVLHIKNGRQMERMLSRILFQRERERDWNGGIENLVVELLEYVLMDLYTVRLH